MSSLRALPVLVDVGEQVVLDAAAPRSGLPAATARASPCTWSRWWWVTSDVGDALDAELGEAVEDATPLPKSTSTASRPVAEDVDVAGVADEPDTGDRLECCRRRSSGAESMPPPGDVATIALSRPKS